METIFALASARGRAGVAVVRISGPRAHEAVSALADDLPPPRRASLRTLVSDSGDVLDRALVLVFEAGASFTGEAAAELHLHGSIAVVDAVLKRLGRLPGLRPAEPGEFTRRALENDRLDLTEVEGLAALIEAETEAQRRQAMRTMSGALRDRVDDWRRRLIRAAALIEATIDFVDEDVPDDVRPEVTALLDGLADEFDRERQGVGVAERLRDGFEVAIVGPPNAGKSTLLNYLAGREAAITSEIAGTTRDVIEVRMDLRGMPVTFLDTAGLRATSDDLESMGVERARRRAEAADVRIFLSCPEALIADFWHPGDQSVIGKADLLAAEEQAVSGRTGQGTRALLARIAEELEHRLSAASTATHQRHAVALETAADHLRDATARLAGDPDQADLVAAEIRLALHALDALIGRVDVEAILDHIFADFCIGK